MNQNSVEGPRFRSPDPVVRLEKAFPSPFMNSIATARTCYSSKGIVRDDQLGQESLPLAKSIYAAGHHTTLQHAHFQFSLSNVSRQFIWSFLHSHPFYNSEQVSQRYVTVKPGRFAIPPLSDEQTHLYVEAVRSQVENYGKLIDILLPKVGQEYLKRFPHRNPGDPRVASALRKKAQEEARYVLPIATFACLYHTVSGITLLRYWRMCDQFDAPAEQKIVVGRMIDALLQYDPQYCTILEEPLPIEQTPEYEFFSSAATSDQDEHRIDEFKREFDQGLDGRISKLVSRTPADEFLVADTVREVLGLPRNSLSNEDAIELAMSPARNRLLADTMNVSTHAKLTRALYHAVYTFRKKLSHAADSQDQRHRTIPASRPVLSMHVTNEPDYIVPVLIREAPEAEQIFHESMQRSWEAIYHLLEQGVSKEFALYLLPNAVSIRYTQSGDLLNLRHKIAMRLCYNAQEEIWRASLEEARQIAQVHPVLGRFLLPPCGLRSLAKVRPTCPEGARYCGVKVWQYALEDYSRII